MCFFKGKVYIGLKAPIYDNHDSVNTLNWIQITSLKLVIDFANP